MTALVFVDTNVLVYARDAGEESKQQRAAEWLRHLWTRRTGRTSVQVLSEYYVTVTRKLSPGLPAEDAWDDVTAMFSWRPQPVDDAVLGKGHEIERRYRLSWWDSLVVAAAERQGCPVLLSEDLQDKAVYAGVTVRSPFTLALDQELAQYSVVPAVRSLHRRRGRPAR